MPELKQQMLVLTLLVSCVGVALSSPFSEKLLQLNDQNLQYMPLPIESKDDTGAVEGRAGGGCHNCGGHTAMIHPTHPSFSAPFDVTSLLGDSKILAMAAPIIILQIITLCVLAYLLRGKGSSYDHPSYIVTHDSGYSDSHYRSLSEGSTMTWILHTISEAMELYNKHQDKEFATYDDHTD